MPVTGTMRTTAGSERPSREISRKTPNICGSVDHYTDLDHGGDIGPHWDFNDRKGPGYRIGPDGTITPK